MFYTYNYQKAPNPVLFQGNKAALDSYLRRHPDKLVVGGGNGTYIIGGESSGQIFEYENEDSPEPIRSAVPSKMMMRAFFEKKRIGEHDFKNLVTALNHHIITFDDILISPVDK